VLEADDEVIGMAFCEQLESHAALTGARKR
jgi:hypothetical protein